MPAKRIPWIKFWPEMLDHEKFAELSDSEGMTWLNVWGKASQQAVRWRFASAQHAAKVSGRPLAQIRRLITARLLDEREDGLWIHDWQQWQNHYPSEYEDSSNTPSTPGEPSPNAHSKSAPTLDEDSVNAPKSLDEDNPNDAVNTTASASRVHERAKKGEGRREKGDIDGTADPADRPPQLISVPKTDRNAEVIDAIRAIGIEPSLTGRDHSAIKVAKNMPPELIAELYGRIYRGEYGDEFLQRNLAVYLVIEKMPGYLAFKANGPPKPVLVGRNGYAERPRRIVDHTGCPPGCPSSHPEQAS